VDPELLEKLAPGARVLDLGARTGSFQSPRKDLTVVRMDLEIVPARAADPYVAADAARMPFAAGAFDAVISNHSLEHFVELEATVREIGRVMRPGGALYVAVPDATTLTDRIYRWLGRGGGHVNAFRSPADVIRIVERLTGLPHRGTRPLISSLSFLNAQNFTARPPRKIALFAFGLEPFLAILIWSLKAIDRAFASRLSHYGWAFYFGSARMPRPGEVWTNVCVRCGAGHPAERLPAHGPSYRCPRCGGWNLRSPLNVSSHK
jgi:SAM-dependent methyltransferase